MEKLTEVLSMGGYAGYVWPSFGFAAVVMASMAIVSLRSLRKAQKRFSDIQQ